MADEERSCLRPGSVDPFPDERRRLIIAFGRAAAETGYRNVDLARVARHAETSPDRLELHFGSKEAVLLAAQDAFLDRLWRDASGACRSAGGFPQGVRAGLRSVISFLAEADALARVFAVEAPGSSFAAAERQLAALDRFASLLGEVRTGDPRAASLPLLTERVMVGGVASLLFAALLAEDTTAMLALEPELAEVLLGPYAERLDDAR